MPDIRFDPADYYHFDLARGAVQTRSGKRVVLLTDEVAAPLLELAVQTGDLTAIRELGTELGQQVMQALGESSDRLPPETVVDHIAILLGLFGWGKLQLERWGPAVVVRIDDLPIMDSEHLGAAALLGGLLSKLLDAEVACVPLRGPTFLVVDPSVAERVWTWSQQGADLTSILGRLAPSRESA